MENELFQAILPEKEYQICNKKADEIFKRVEVWSNRNWRLTMSLYSALKGFCYLEPKRHIPFITDLDGKEALEFGSILANVANALKSATNAELIHIYIYGGHIPHLHVHLAPHKEGDLFVDDVIKEGVKIEESLMKPEDVTSLTNTMAAILNPRQTKGGRNF
jgi:diadenosine tetraphosphate (Ap4A) HIT family hydrolase